ncbi:HAD hydrolase-like protein, partial [Janthinobacterium sp. HH106]|uniref:HAD family hydrolase n=1 Tax=Janthinobacterium sp. HH106 TaxID=1537278 RepID=UPI000A8467C6
MITDHLPAPRAILFDLDGTLADTAPDLAAAINLLRARAGLAPTPYDILRPTASAGARGMIGASYGVQPGESGYEALKDGFLNNYEAALAVESRLFDGIPAMLEGLSALGLAWGVVTNKAARFTDPLVGQIGLGGAGCVISGDTMPHPKPH